MAERGRVGLVLAGGGARGAYEAGVLSVLLPALEDRGERPTVLVGSSVGAINVAFLAGSQHLRAREAAEGLVERWRRVDIDEVVRPLLRDQLPRQIGRALGGALGVPGVRLSSVLDPAPINANLERWNDWAALRGNVDAGDPHAVAVVATAARSERTVVFCDSAEGPPRHRSHVLDYVACPIGVEHVRAAAAIPLAFPPVRVEHPLDARGWYVDGGTRLNTPIKPALDLGVDRVVVVATASVQGFSTAPHGRGDAPPDLADGALNMLHGKLVDPLIEDMRTLGNVNTFFVDGDAAPGSFRYRRARSKPPYQRVPYVFVGPHRPGALGDLAAEVFADRYTGLRALRSPGMALINWWLGTQDPSHSELFSYLFFDPTFLDELIRRGADDARLWLDTATGAEAPWRTDPLDAFIG
jgi:NTE family protein